LLNVRLKLVMTLMDDSRADEIRLLLPVSIGSARYGLPLPEAQDASSPEASTRVRFSASIQTSGVLRTIYSPSHKDVDIAPYATHKDGKSSRHRALASFSSTSFLLDDFVLVVRADGLDAPRCFAEVDDARGTVALQLAVIPKFDIPRPPEQEYLFLVDRSGSMSGNSIEMAKQALKLLLRILPEQGSYINVWSFGSICDHGLWPMSRSYSPESLQHAVKSVEFKLLVPPKLTQNVQSAHIGGMEADMGGTEITTAVDNVLQSRMTSMSTIVYILTDGSVSIEYQSNDFFGLQGLIQPTLI
jgi:hypothetical protein